MGKMVKEKKSDRIERIERLLIKRKKLLIEQENMILNHNKKQAELFKKIRVAMNKLRLGLK